MDRAKLLDGENKRRRYAPGHFNTKRSAFPRRLGYSAWYSLEKAREWKKRGGRPSNPNRIGNARIPPAILKSIPYSRKHSAFKYPTPRTALLLRIAERWQNGFA